MQCHLVLLAVLAALVHASPYPQGVTEAIAPKQTSPPRCSPSYNGKFGISVAPLRQKLARRGEHEAILQIGNGQVRAARQVIVGEEAFVPVTIRRQKPFRKKPKHHRRPLVPVSQVGDGQLQAPTTTKTPLKTMCPVTQIEDGQIHAPHSMTPCTTLQPVTRIEDGQIQAPKSLKASLKPLRPITQINDGQIQAPTTTPKPTKPLRPVTQIGDGQIQAPPTTISFTTKTIISTTLITKAPVTQIADNQIQAPTTTKVFTSVFTSVTTMPVHQHFSIEQRAPEALPSPQGDESSSYAVACKAKGSLELELKDGRLLDAVTRTGYIASNFQFQFDNPPQAGSIYTSGWSTCKNETLALGGSNIFYQCLSGDFYNLYDRYWAPHCEAIELQLVKLVDC